MSRRHATVHQLAVPTPDGAQNGAQSSSQHGTEEGGPVLTAEEARSLLVSMAAMTRVVFGVALQGPRATGAGAERSATADPDTAAAATLPLAPLTVPGEEHATPAPVPDPPSMPALPLLAAVPDPLTDPLSEHQPDPLGLAPQPSVPVPGTLPLAPEEHPTLPPRSTPNLGLLQEIAFLDD